MKNQSQKTFYEALSSEEKHVRVFRDCYHSIFHETHYLEALESVINQMHANQVDFMLAGVIGPVRDILFKAGLRELIGKDNLFLHVQQAIDDYHNRMDERSERLQAKALQTNVRARKSDPTKDQ